MRLFPRHGANVSLLRAFAVSLPFVSSTLALWPAPKYFEHGTDTVWLSSAAELTYLDRSYDHFVLSWARNTFEGIYEGVFSLFQRRSNLEHRIPDTFLVQNAFGRLKTNLFNNSFVPTKFYARKASFEPKVSDSQKTIGSVKVKLAGNVSPGLNASLESDESYKLIIDGHGDASIVAKSTSGVLHALQTLEQLLLSPPFNFSCSIGDRYTHSSPVGGVYCPYVPLKIVDEPAFEHRGINVDISRNWIPPQDILRVIDAMASNKMNRLHIHASDSQSWPLDIPSLPELAAEGAYQPTQVWSVSELRNVQRHGYLHGVSVYLEIDIPGHTTSIYHSYPDLITAENQEPWSKYAEEPPSGQLKLNHSAVTLFLTTLLNDLLPRTKTFSPFFHLGGDELNIRAYSFEPSIPNTPNKSSLRPLVQQLLTHALTLTKSHSLTPILWEEMLLEWNLTLPPSTIIQTWRSNEALLEVLQTGHRVLFGANTHWYLDCGLGVFLDPKDPDHPAPDARINPPYQDYCGPFHNWRHVYSYDPLTGIPAEQQRRVLGGEVHLWSELTDSVTLDWMLWPRAAAAAEVLWRGTGVAPVSEEVTRRLAEWRERAVAKGVRAGVVQMEWCLRNKGGCLM